MKIKNIRDKSACQMLFCLLFFAYAYICMTKNCFSSSMVFIVNEGLLTKFQTGVISASFYVFYAVLQILGGVVTDKYNPERLITMGLVGAAVTNAIVYFNQSYYVMLAAWILNGCLQFAVWPATFKIVSTMLRDDMQNSSIFVITLGNPAGVIMSYALAAIIGANWRTNFLVSAVGLLIIALVWEIAFGRIRSKITEIEVAEYTPCVTAQGTKQSFVKTAIMAGMPLLLILSFVRTMFDLGIKAVAPVMINESYSGITPVFATVLSICILVSGTVGPFITHLIYPKLIKNEAVGVTLFFLVTTPLVIALLALGKVSYPIIVILLSLVVMLMSAASLFTTSYVAARFNPLGKGATVAGLLNSAASIGVVVANAMFTGIADNAGWHDTIMVWIGIIIFASVISVANIPVWSRFLKNRNY